MNHVPTFSTLSAVAVYNHRGQLVPMLFALDFNGRAWSRLNNEQWRLVPSQTPEPEENYP